MIAGSSRRQSRRTRGDQETRSDSLLSRSLCLSLHLVARSLAHVGSNTTHAVLLGLLLVQGDKEEMYAPTPASTRSFPLADPSWWCVPGLEDFDAEGRCGRCVSRGVHCERTKPVRKPGGNPHGKRANSTAANSTAKTRNARTSTTANGHGHGQSHLTTPPSLDDLSTVALSMAGTDGHHHQHQHHHHLQYGASLPPYNNDNDNDSDSMQLPIPPPIPSTSAVPYSGAPTSLPLPVPVPSPGPLPLPLPCNPWDQMFGFLESDPSATLSVDPTLPHFDWAALTANQPNGPALPLPLPPPAPTTSAAPSLSPPAASAPPTGPTTTITTTKAALPTGMETILNGLASARNGGPSSAADSGVASTPQPALEDDPLDQDLTDDMAVICESRQ